MKEIKRSLQTTCFNLGIRPYFSIDFEWDAKSALEIKDDFEIMFQQDGKTLSKNFSWRELHNPVTLAEHVRDLFAVKRECAKLGINVNFEKSEKAFGIMLHQIVFEKDCRFFESAYVDAQIKQPKFIAVLASEQLGGGEKNESK